MKLDQILTTFANGSVPQQRGEEFITRCPICMGDLHFAEKETAIAMICHGEQCRAVDILAVHGLKTGDLKLSKNGKKAKAGKTPPSNPPPDQGGPNGSNPVPTFRHSDYENAERLMRRHGADIRYCATWSRWLTWDGARWKEDKTLDIVRRAKETVRHIYAEAANVIDTGDRRALIEHGKKSESSGRIAAMITLAQSERPAPVVPEDLDGNEWLLSCPNGTVDLRTGKLMPASRDNLLTKLCPTNFNPEATAPTWEAFLNKIFQENQDLIGFVQRMAGYALTGVISERCLFILYGNKGRNGKSTLLETLKSVMGEDFATTTTAELLIAKHNVGDLAMTAYLAELKGYRLVTCSETEDGKRLAEAAVKSMTGDEKINAKRLYSQPFQYTPQFKIMLATNHKPEIRGTDEAIWDRIKLIPFEVRITDAELNPNLKSELLAEAEGILAWMVRGCLEWKEKKLGVSDDVALATKAYRLEMDTFQGFIDECLIIEDGAAAKSAEIYQAYKAWSEQNGEWTQKQRWVGQRLSDMGFFRMKGTGGVRQWARIRVIKPGEQKLF